MRLLILTLLLASSFGATWANTPPADPGKPDLSVGVFLGNTRQPMKNVSVSVVSHKTKETKQVTTNADGSYAFDNLKTGHYKVIFQKEGYKSLVRESVYIREDENFQFSVEMLKAEPYRLIPGIILFQ